METTEATFTAKDVMSLRQETDMPMMDCKKALTEANGDKEKAKELLFAKRKGKMDQRTERATGEGRIVITVDESNQHAVIVEIRTETDFTARNEAFMEAALKIADLAMKQPQGEITADETITKIIDQQRVTTGENVNFSRGEKLEGGHYGSYVHHDGKRAAIIEVDKSLDHDLLKGLCQHIVFHDPQAISEQDVPSEELDRIRQEAIAEAKESGKPDEISQKIAEGKVRKYLEEKTLLNQPYILDENKQVKDVLGGANITRFIRYTLGG